MDIRIGHRLILEIDSTFSEIIKLPTLSYSILYKIVLFQSAQCLLSLYFTNRFDSTLTRNYDWTPETTTSFIPYLFSILINDSFLWLYDGWDLELWKYLGILKVYQGILSQEHIGHTGFRKGCNSQSWTPLSNGYVTLKCHGFPRV